MKIFISLLVVSLLCGLVQGGYWNLNSFNMDGVKPEARSESSLVMTSETTMLMFGGVLDGTYWDPVGDVWKFDTVEKKWTMLIENKNGSEFTRTQQTAIYIAHMNKVIIYGGISYILPNQKFISTLRDMYEFDVATNQLTKIVYNGNSPSPRAKPCLVHIPETSTLILYGGLDTSSTYTDMWEFNLDTQKWTQMHPQGKLPAIANSYCTYAPSEKKIFFFGGENVVRGKGSRTYDGLWTYDFRTNHWLLMKTKGEKLPPLAGHVMVWHSQRNSLFLHGGCSKWTLDSTYRVHCPEISGDVFQYDIKTNTWIKDQEAGSLPRRDHSGAIVQDEFWIFGGEEESYQMLNSLAQYEVTSSATNLNPLQENNPNNKTGVIIGAVIGTTTMVVLGVVLAFIFIRRRNNRKSMEQHSLLQPE